MENKAAAESVEIIENLALEKINFGENLLRSISNFNNIEGLQKLARKINQEIKFLKKVVKSKLIKKEHLQCSNLTHFAALIDELKNVDKCQSVNKVFVLENEPSERKITVDIVCDDGLTWMKVVARNPKSLSQICKGDASYGVRSILDQAEEFVQCAKLYPCLFQTPNIIFKFANGIGTNIAAKLEAMNITVLGERITKYDIDHSSSEDEDDSTLDSNRNPEINCKELSTRNVSSINKVNLDVSAMLAYCSSVTNGSADKYEFTVPVLRQQAAWEVLRPQKPLLDAFFANKQLYCCETAKTNFENIVNTVGGPTEQIRARDLLNRVTVLPDDASADDSEESKDIFNNVQFTGDKTLKAGGKIKERSLIIFTFGDRIKAVTVTANDGFVRAAKQQGINFVVFVHESRALTEQKEHLKGRKCSN